ncbi:hypothetical protein HDU76_003212 [Blyttiomyces sp. JEL0837]|nr:hypothetical protein HDU76_003212 [Blyttiomyces sp. JEL0837]
MSSTTALKVSTVFAPGNLALITGAATGIGRAMATHCASIGMSVILVDKDTSNLTKTSSNLSSTYPSSTILSIETDVSSLPSIQHLHQTIKSHFPTKTIQFLMNNAGTAIGTSALKYDTHTFTKTIETNFNSILYTCNLFLPDMISSNLPCIIVNTGSKQGITCPPGNLSYNVSKAAVKVYTEGLQHELRNTNGGLVSAHLLVPGWVNTNIFYNVVKESGADEQKLKEVFSEENPATGAYMPRQVVNFLLDGLKEDRFYIICPDNEVDLATDHARILWAAGDIVEDRSPLSRWDPKYAEEFKEFLASRVGGVGK